MPGINEEVVDTIINKPWSLTTEQKSKLSSDDGTSVIINYEQTDVKTGKVKPASCNISECHCCPPLSRQNSSSGVRDLRIELEDLAFKSIKEHYFDKNSVVTIGSVGGDYLGITRLLAKLYKEGYTKVNVVMLGKTSLVGEYTSTLEIRSLWKDLFPNITIKFTVASNNEGIHASGPKKSEKKETTLITPINHIFLLIEDLGAVDKSRTYPSTVSLAIKEAEVALQSQLKDAYALPAIPSVHSYYVGHATKSCSLPIELAVKERHDGIDRDSIVGDKSTISLAASSSSTYTPYAVAASSSSSSTSTISSDEALARQLQESLDREYAEQLQKEENGITGTVAKISRPSF